MDELPGANTTADEEAELFELMFLLGHPVTERECFDMLASTPSSCACRYQASLQCDTCRKKHWFRCSVQPELHRITSTSPSTSNVKVVTTQNKKTHKVSPPHPCVLNHNVGIDVIEVLGAVRKRFSMLNAVWTSSWIRPLRRTKKLSCWSRCFLSRPPESEKNA